MSDLTDCALLDPAELLQSLAQRHHAGLRIGIVGRRDGEDADAPHARPLLRAYRESEKTLLGNGNRFIAFLAVICMGGSTGDEAMGLRAHPNCAKRTTIRLVIACAILTAIAREAGAQSGIASIYAYKSGRTASGEHAHPHGFTAAHRTLPFGTKVHVTNRRNGQSVVVRINDRGPFVRSRVIDVTPAAARSLGFSGITSVVLAVVK